jgi:hypothetical protein
MAFKHEATLLVDGREVETAKICYQNRTWERYDFESVLYKIVEGSKYLSDEEKAEAIEYIKNYQEPSPFRAVAAVAKMGDIFTNDKKGANDWKARMLKAGLGEANIQMPDDWDTLSEDEKEDRLNKAIKSLE